MHLTGIRRDMTCVICLPGGYLHHLFGHGGIAFPDGTFPRRMFPPDRDSCNLSLILYLTYYNVIDVTFRFPAAAC